MIGVLVCPSVSSAAKSKFNTTMMLKEGSSFNRGYQSAYTVCRLQHQWREKVINMSYY